MRNTRTHSNGVNASTSNWTTIAPANGNILAWEGSNPDLRPAWANHPTVTSEIIVRAIPNIRQMARAESGIHQSLAVMTNLEAWNTKLMPCDLLFKNRLECSKEEQALNAQSGPGDCPLLFPTNDLKS
jgi:hypothetical protein